MCALNGLAHEHCVNVSERQPLLPPQDNEKTLSKLRVNIMKVNLLISCTTETSLTDFLLA